VMSAKKDEPGMHIIESDDIRVLANAT